MTIKLEMTLWEWAKQRSWSGGRTTLQYLTIEEIDALESIIQDWDWTDEVQLNDWFWFDTDQVLELLGIEQEDWDQRKPLRNFFSWIPDNTEKPF